MKNKGFTLIEILVAIAIVITSTTIVVAILTTSFRISNKTTSIDAVRENGDHAMGQMSRLIQYADSFQISDGVDTYTECTDPVVAAKKYSSVAVVYSGQLNKKISCTSNGLEIDGTPLLNLQKVSLVSGSCSFTCSQDLGVSPIIKISFDLVLNNTSSLSEKSARINFSTSVKMRNN